MASIYDPPASPPQEREDCLSARDPFGPVLSLLREEFDITEPDGHKLTGRLFGTKARPSGRRITVSDAGRVIFDSDDCYDLGNARYHLDEFLAKRERSKRQANPTDPTDAANLCVG